MATSVITTGKHREHRISTGVLAGAVVALAAFVGFSVVNNDPTVVTPEVLTPIERNAPAVPSHITDLEGQVADSVAADQSFEADQRSLQNAIDDAIAVIQAQELRDAQQGHPGNVR